MKDWGYRAITKAEGQKGNKAHSKKAYGKKAYGKKAHRH